MNSSYDTKSVGAFECRKHNAHRPPANFYISNGFLFLTASTLIATNFKLAALNGCSKLSWTLIAGGCFGLSRQLERRNDISLSQHDVSSLGVQTC